MKKSDGVQDILAANSVQTSDQYSLHYYFGVVEDAMLRNIRLSEAMFEHEFGRKRKRSFGLGLGRIGVLS
jgi:hypothetical protein